MSSSPEETGSTDPQRRRLFTVFIPAYNRAHTLPRAYDSLLRQTCQDFELIVVDDGSTDDTAALVRAWQASPPFPVIYFWQENQGKHVAHNTALGLARGELFVLLDSDDMLADNALERIKYHWERIPVGRRERFAGVEGLCVDLEGRLSGDRFPQDVFESDYLETRYWLGVGGEKKNAIRLDVLKQYPYPQFAGEKHIRDSLLWERISERYRFLYINEILQIFEYQPEGMTRNIFKVRMTNPRGFRFYYLEDIHRQTRYFTFSHKLDSYARFIRFSLHSGVGLTQQWAEVPCKWIWLVMLPKAVIKWQGDRIKMTRLGMPFADGKQ